MQGHKTRLFFKNIIRPEFSHVSFFEKKKKKKSHMRLFSFGLHAIYDYFGINTKILK